MVSPQRNRFGEMRSRQGRLGACRAFFPSPCCGGNSIPSRPHGRFLAGLNAIFAAIRRASSLLSSLSLLLLSSGQSRKSLVFRFVSGATTRKSDMAVNRIALIGLSVLVLSATTTIALAQNTSNPLRSGNTVNPILSGNTVAAGREAPISPAPSVPSLSTGTNPFTGQPCSGPPTTGGTTTSAGAAFPSVYGPPPSSC
jgi:hypothetical protein